MRRIALGLVLLAGGCSSGGMGLTADEGGAHDGGDGGGPDLGPYHGPIDLPFTGTLHWSDGDNALGPVRAANLDGNVGTVVYHGVTLDALLYREIPFGPYDLAAIVASAPHNLVVLYAYCKGDGVANWYYESLDEPVTLQLVSSAGHCALPHTPVTAEPSFEPFLGPPPDLRAATSATVDGATLQIAGGQGSAQIGGTSYDVAAFDFVDCSSGCGSPGWYELHSLLRRDTEVAFGIIYLIEDDPTHARLNYGVRFDVPALTPPDTIFAATWTVK